jgi:PadR family transcriptional regulator, regulatory protein PadR
MEKVETLGQFEQLVLLATYLLRGEGYSVSIRDEVNARSSKRVMLGAVYVSLERLERRGLVSSHFAEPTPIRGGKAKRYFKVTPAGEKALALAKFYARQLVETLNALEDRVKVVTGTGA